jgi:hypothetical protein
MKSVVRPELSTAAAGSSQAPTAAVDNSAPLLTTPESTYRSGKSVQTTGATSALGVWMIVPPFQKREKPVRVRVRVVDQFGNNHWSKWLNSPW